jgi:hypothetical protein
MSNLSSDPIVFNNCNIKKNASHHHMSMIASTHVSEIVRKTINTPFFVKIWNVPKKHMPLLKRRS